MNRLLEGDERLERWPLGRRVVRMGAPEALAVGDLTCARTHAQQGRSAEAAAYVEAMHGNHLMMIEVTYEWCLRANRELATRGKAQLAQAAEREWLAIAAVTPERPIPAVFKERLSAAFIGVHLDGELAKKRGKTLSLPNPALTAELESLRAGALTAEGIDRYFAHARTCHDLLIEYLWAFSTAVAAGEGEALARELLAGAFRSVPAVNMLWPALHLFSPLESAFFLADHLRGHFSGAGRAGAVQIIEEPDRYRLVMDPCGSGGAIRRKLPLAGQGAEASPESWGQSGVPFYCMHCAHNELRSIDVVGFPRWVTEYDPDPEKPCGWTIYKDPRQIPDRYFERLGRKKNPSRMKRTGGALGKLRALFGALGVMLRSR